MLESAVLLMDEVLPRFAAAAVDAELSLPVAGNTPALSHGANIDGTVIKVALLIMTIVL
jgi:hypothetical protein